MIRLFLILALACQSLASGDTAQVASPAELVSTLQQESVTTIVLTHNIWLCDEHWPSTGPIWLARNVTITAQLPSTLLHVCFEGKKKGVLGLKPHTTLTFKKLVVKAVSKSALQFDLITASPGGAVLLHDGIWITAVCAPPSLVRYAVGSMARSERFPGENGQSELERYCVTPTQCYKNAYYTIDLAFEQPLVVGKEGGCTVWLKNQHWLCMVAFTEECVKAKGTEKCRNDLFEQVLSGKVTTDTGDEVPSWAMGAMLTVAAVLVGCAYVWYHRVLFHTDLDSPSSSRANAISTGTNAVITESGSLLAHQPSSEEFSHSQLQAQMLTGDPMIRLMAAYNSTKAAAARTQAPNSGDALRHSSEKSMLGRAPTSQGLGRTELEAFLEECKLGPLLGAGSYGKVYRAAWREQQVAVKIIAHSRAMVAKVRSEAETASRFTHSNIVAVLHSFTSENPTNCLILDAQDSNPSSSLQLGGEGSSGRLSGKAAISGHLVLRQGSGTNTQGSNPWAGPGPSSTTATAGGTSHGSSQMLDNHEAFTQDAWASTPGEPSSRAAEMEAMQTVIVQEYCDLGSLSDSLFHSKRWRTPDANNIDMKTALHVALDIASGMAYLHENSVLHGDLKAHNVLLRTSPNNPIGMVAKISDFGLSRTLTDGKTHLSTDTFGTITHMPPELLKDGHLTPACDVYSFGVLLWELATGSPFFEGLSHAQVLHKIVIEEFRPNFPAHVPEAFCVLAKQCWAKVPSERPTFKHAVKELEKLISAGSWMWDSF